MKFTTACAITRQRARCRRDAVCTAISPTVSCPTRPSTWWMRPAPMIRTEIDSMPAELDDLRRKIMQLEIEEMALKKEDDELSQRASCRRLKKELADEKEQFNAMKARWEAEKNGVDERARSSRARSSRCTARSSRHSASLEYEKAAQAASIPICPRLKSSSRTPRLRPRSTTATTPWCTTP